MFQILWIDDGNWLLLNFFKLILGGIILLALLFSALSTIIHKIRRHTWFLTFNFSFFHHKNLFPGSNGKEMMLPMESHESIRGAAFPMICLIDMILDNEEAFVFTSVVSTTKSSDSNS